MASLFFLYSTMNAGKSTHLLQNAHNYKEREMKPLLFTAEVDDRYGNGVITSRIGISAEARVYNPNTCFLEIDDFVDYDIIFIDEAQFLTSDHVEELCEIVDNYNIPVMAYGLKTDSKSNLFEGSAALLRLADKLVELKTICGCGNKAIMTARVDEAGEMVLDGPQVEIGGNTRYQSYCRKCYGIKKRAASVVQDWHLHW